MKLFFRRTGSGKPLVILHGLFGSSDNWMTIAKKLEDQFDLIIPDLRNHGQSPKSDSWDYDVMTEDLEELIHDQCSMPPFILGHSMGGKLAMEFALDHPDQVEKLVVADIAPKEYPPHHGEILKGLNSISPSDLPSRKEADEMLSKFVPEFGVRAFLLKNLGRKESGELFWKINLPVITNLIENVGRPITGQRVYKGPTLFMRGEKSKYISDQDFSNAEGFFPNSILETVSNAGHWLHAEKPEEFVMKLLTFLEKD